MSTDINYKEKYDSILKEVATLKIVTDMLHSVAIKQNANNDTVESLTIIKQTVDAIINKRNIFDAT